VPADGAVPHLAVAVVAIEERLREGRRPDVLAALDTAAREVAIAIRAAGDRSPGA